MREFMREETPPGTVTVKVTVKSAVVAPVRVTVNVPESPGSASAALASVATTATTGRGFVLVNAR